MTIEELKRILGQFPSGQEILMSIDPEGNAFRPVTDYSSQIYCPRSGAMFNLDELDEVGNQLCQKVLVLWPG